MIIMRGAGPAQRLITRGFGAFIQEIIALVSQIFAMVTAFSKVDNIETFLFSGASDELALCGSGLGDGSFEANSQLGGAELLVSGIASEITLYSQLIEE